MSILRVGATKKFSEGWERAFGGKKKSRPGKPTARAAGKSAKKAASGGLKKKKKRG